MSVHYRRKAHSGERPAPPNRDRRGRQRGDQRGCTPAAQGEQDVAVIDPAATHYYQPLWTLVGGGCAPLEASAKPQKSVMPKGVTWIRKAAVGVDPEAKEISLDDGSTVATTTW